VEVAARRTGVSRRKGRDSFFVRVGQENDLIRRYSAVAFERK
jgi:hypothetical protein